MIPPSLQQQEEVGPRQIQKMVTQNRPSAHQTSAKYFVQDARYFGLGIPNDSLAHIELYRNRKWLDLC
jgi:hypothetical protein